MSHLISLHIRIAIYSQDVIKNILLNYIFVAYHIDLQRKVSFYELSAINTMSSAYARQPNLLSPTLTPFPVILILIIKCSWSVYIKAVLPNVPDLFFKAAFNGYLFVLFQISGNKVIIKILLYYKISTKYENIYTA